VQADAKAFSPRRWPGKTGLRAGPPGKKVFFVFLFLCAWASGAQENPPALPQKIPILFSDHHADHALWLLQRGGGGAATLLVVDAHADTSHNAALDFIRACIKTGNYGAADDLFQNHNWIHPLVPLPAASLVWISGISGLPENERYNGFTKSTAGWNIRRRCLTLNEFDGLSPAGNTLFVSVDLDFFYGDRSTPQDIPFVLDRLLGFSLRWPGKVVWAVCVSRAWLPTAEYAWEVLEQSLAWLARQTAFGVPELTLFSKDRHDGSRRAQAFRLTGARPPGLYQKEDEAPLRIRELLAELGAREY
jgi:hypothetical protein